MKLADLPTPLKICLSLFFVCIALGVFQAQLYLRFKIGNDSAALLPSVKEVENHFFVEKIPILRRAIDTNMSEYVETEEDRKLFYTFMEKKAPRELYETQLKPVLEFSCLECHSEGGEAASMDFSTYEGIRKKAIFSYRPHIRQRLKIAHPHMLAIPLFLLPLALGIWFTPLKERTRGILMAMPFCGVILDISAWFLTMYYKKGVWLILIGGGITTLGVFMSLLVVFYSLWIAQRKTS